MAFTVEDGTGVTGANSYRSVADADAYHAQWGNTDWAGLTNEEKELALLKGTRYIELKFGSRFMGARTYKHQGLSWPRVGVVDDDGYAYDYNEMPEALGDATNEAALRSSVEDMMPDVEAGSSAGLVAELITMGEMTISEQYGGSQSIDKQYRVIEKLLMTAGLIGGVGAERG